MKKVLILLATYNGEKYLRKQLDSIFKQKNIELYVLVRDDGSNDSTQDILDEYKNRGLIEWYSGEHINIQRGYYELMKKALKIETEYIAFCDQDDVWDSDKLCIAVNYLYKSKPGTPALYYCGQRLVDEKLKFIANHTLNEKRTLNTRFILSDFAGCTGVFNKALLEEVVKYEPKYMLMHDTWILKVCLCLGGDVYVDSKCHMSYRQHGNNTIGLGRNFFSYIKQVKQYLFDYQVERQMHELMTGYGDRMVLEYKKLAIIICRYKKNKKYKSILLDKNYINFYNKGLNLTYWLKVVSNKL